MKMIKLAIVSIISIFVLTGNSFAKDKEIELYIKNMTCPSCPIIIKKTLLKIDGVKKVETDYLTRTATVIFDDSKISQKNLVNASTNQGYPAKIQ